MTILLTLLLSIVTAFTLFKARAAIKRRTIKRIEVHRVSIEPSLSFYINEDSSSELTESRIFLKNIGNGKAKNIEIKEFYHPKEKAWHFNFQRIPSLSPEEEINIDYTFSVGKQKAFNKHDQLWMFDPDHDHDFVAEIVINFLDIDGNNYRQTNRVGDGKNQPCKPKLLKEPKAKQQK